MSVTGAFEAMPRRWKLASKRRSGIGAFHPTGPPSRLRTELRPFSRGAFIPAKAKGGVVIAADGIEHLTLHLRLLSARKILNVSHKRRPRGDITMRKILAIKYVNRCVMQSLGAFQ
jgi:hypothetical protein